VILNNEKILDAFPENIVLKERYINLEIRDVRM